MFISPAYAQSANGVPGFDFLLPFILIFVIFYMLVIRPQQKRVKQHNAMVSGLHRGDTVVTGGGLVGKVTRVIDDKECLVEVAEGLRVRVVSATIVDVRGKTELVKDVQVKDSGPDKKSGKNKGGRQ